MQLYKTRDSILKAAKKGILFTRVVNRKGKKEFIEAIRMNSKVEFANVNGYKALIKSGKLKENKVEYVRFGATLYERFKSEYIK